MPAFPTAAVRSRFPGLARRVAGRPAVFLDGPAGSQVPRVVVDAVGRYLAHTNANTDGAFATSVETDRMMERAHAAVADLLGTGSPEEVVFGPNMTTLTLLLSDALAGSWRAGDEVVVTRLDHDANVTPWVAAAGRAGARVRHAGVVASDCTLDLDGLRAALSERTRLVAVTAASNLVGTRTDVAEIARLAHGVGALLFVDAVHHAPHGLIDVPAWGCDFLACSAYKFFGPHVGVLWGRGELLRAMPSRRLRAASDALPLRWMHGTQNHEGIAGTAAAVDYLADLGRELAGAGLGRRPGLAAAFDAIGAHERALVGRLLAGLGDLEDVAVFGITDPARLAERAPTVAFTHRRHRPREVCRRLAEEGIFAWAGNNYALPLTEALGLEPDGVVRVGLLHYNTAEEVDRLLDALRRRLA